MHPRSRQSNFVPGGRRGKLFICKTWENFATGAKSGKLRDNKARQGKFVIDGKRGKLRICKSEENFATATKRGKLCNWKAEGI